MKRFLSAFLVLLLLFAGAKPVSATPPTIDEYEGLRQAGVTPADPECPIKVEHMLLTFDLQELVNPTTGSEEELASYTGKVTMEYTFYNPTDTAITTKFMFYVGYPDIPSELLEKDMDKYNILVDGQAIEKTLCSLASNPSGVNPGRCYDTSRWYVYEITLQPGQRLENTLIAPIYPSVKINYEPQKYDYYYHPCPVTWKSIGGLDVVINTPFHLLSHTGEYEKTETGYKASFNEIPPSYVHFELCASENPEEIEPEGSSWRWFVLLAIIIFSFVDAFEAIGEFFTNLFQNLF